MNKIALSLSALLLLGAALCGQAADPAESLLALQPGLAYEQMLAAADGLRRFKRKDEDGDKKEEVNQIQLLEIMAQNLCKYVDTEL